MVDPQHEPSGRYPLALSADIEPGTSAGTRLFGHELVVWRDATGTAHVWEDRCPHRGMRLSFGFVRGDHIACLYHGWRYDTAGQCRYIPAHPDLEVGPLIRARTYPTMERQGLVWVAWGASSLPDGEERPNGMPTPLRSLYLDAPAEQVLDALGAAPGEDGLVRLSLAGVPVLIALQPLSTEQSAAHVLIDGAADAADSAERTQIAHACTALRHRIETAAAGRTTERGNRAVSLVLYDYALDENGYKVRLLLGALQVPHATVAVDMIPGAEQTRPPLIDLNPLGTLPILVDGPTTLRDAEAILVYLARAHDPAGTWLPQDAAGLAATMMWLVFSARDLHAATLARRAAMFDAPGDAAALERAAREAFRIMEDHMVLQGLAGAPWFAGSSATIADLALFPAIALSRDHGIDHESYPVLRRWMRRVRTLPGFCTMPGIPDYH